MLRVGDSSKALSFLDKSLKINPLDSRTILGWGSITQDNQNTDSSLLKYRIMAVRNPSSCQLWNNVGMCFFSRGDYVSSISCLKRALYLNPFEWIVSYNLGLVYLKTNQYASAFHHFHSSVSLKPDFATSCMYLAVTLARLNDMKSSYGAYEKAISLAGPNDHVIYLNYSITLYNHNEIEKAKQIFNQYEKMFNNIETQNARNIQNRKSRSSSTDSLTKGDNNVIEHDEDLLAMSHALRMELMSSTDDKK
jgi:Bardet-Biedl syndrome 4 protein